MPSVVRLIHPAPAMAVVVLSAALGMILSSQSRGDASTWRVALTVLAVLGSQVVTGALNDWTDRDRDALVQPEKPIPSGEVGPRTALMVAAAGLVLQVGASIPLGPLALALGMAALGSAVAYNVWLARTPLSVVPYLVSFGILPVWIAAGVGVPLERVAAAPIIVGPFAAAAHLANTLRDFEADRRTGSRNLSQVLGRRTGFLVAWTLAMSVGVAVGLALAPSGRLGMPSVMLGMIGLAAVGQGVAGPHRLWIGMLVAAVSWTVAWALATG